MPNANLPGWMALAAAITVALYVLGLATLFAAQRRILFRPDRTKPEAARVEQAGLVEVRVVTADGLNLLALLSTGSGVLNRINAAVFRSTAASKLLYPALRLGRNLTLRALGRRKIDPA